MQARSATKVRQAGFGGVSIIGNKSLEWLPGTQDLDVRSAPVLGVAYRLGTFNSDLPCSRPKNRGIQRSRLPSTTTTLLKANCARARQICEPISCDVHIFFRIIGPFSCPPWLNYYQDHADTSIRLPIGPRLNVIQVSLLTTTFRLLRTPVA